MTNLRRDADKVATMGVSKLNKYIKTTEMVLANVRGYKAGKEKEMVIAPEFCLRVMVENMERIKTGFEKILRVYIQHPEGQNPKSFKKHMAIHKKIEKMDKLIGKLREWS